MIRQAAAILALPALAMSASATTAFASHHDDHDKKYKEVKVVVCKKVYNDHDNDDRFKFKLWTDSEYEDVYVRAGHCKDVYLKWYEKSRVDLKEYKDDDYKVKRFDVPTGSKWDTDSYWRTGDYSIRVKFDHDRHAKVKIIVINEKHHDDDHDDDDHDDGGHN